MSSFALPPDISWADEVFDGMLTSRAAIYKKKAILDSYGQIVGSTSEYVRLDITKQDGSVVQDIPCLVQDLKGEELNTPPAPQSQTSYGVKQYKIFLRPIMVDSPAVRLNIRHFMQILSKAQLANGEDYKDPNDPNQGVLLYNLTDVSNPAQQDHHLEATATVLTP